MDPFEAAIDLVFLQTSWLAVMSAVALFVFVGWARVPTLLALGFAALCSFFYVVSLTRGLEQPGTELLIMRIVASALLTLAMFIVYWAARVNLRSLMSASKRR